MSTIPDETKMNEDDLKEDLKKLQLEYLQHHASPEENIPFQNAKFMEDLTDLGGDASFSPLSSKPIYDNYEHNQNTLRYHWEIVFNHKWQQYDQRNTFDKLSKYVHTDKEYSYTLSRYKHILTEWEYKLGLEDNHKKKWFRPPIHPSPITFSLELELPEQWDTYYRKALKSARQRRYTINFEILQLSKTSHCNLIDAIYFAKCINWDAAYDPTYSAKTNIPLYWIFAQIKFNLPTAIDPNGNVIEYHQSIYNVPISCYGLMSVPVNTIKDWYKLSPHFDKCRDWRARLQIGDEVEVFLWDKWWEKAKIIDIVIINSNTNQNTQIPPQQPIIEYLQVQCTNDAILRYNRYDDRIRPFMSSSKVQEKNAAIKYSSDILSDIELKANDDILQPTDAMHQNAAPSYHIGKQHQQQQPTVHIPQQPTNNNNKPQDPRQKHHKIQQIQNNGSDSQHLPPPLEMITNTHDIDEYKVSNHKNIGPNDPTPEIVSDAETESDDHENEENDDNTQSPHINQELFDDFDPNNKRIIKQYQTDLEETMETIKKLALHRTVVTDIFRPVHLSCPKDIYRVSLTDEDEVNMSVIERNKEYEYVNVKMLDPEMSDMDVYMTHEQLFLHCNTYFHFADMQQQQQPSQSESELLSSSRKYNQTKSRPTSYKKCKKKESDYSAGQIHQYIKSKDSSSSPQRRANLCPVEKINQFYYNGSTHSSSPQKNYSMEDDPRSHLQDNMLQSFLHGIDDDDDNQQHSLVFDDNKEINDEDPKQNWLSKHFASSSGTYDTLNDEIPTSNNNTQGFLPENWTTRPHHLGLGASDDDDNKTDEKQEIDDENQNENGLFFASWGSTWTDNIGDDRSNDEDAEDLEDGDDDDDDESRNHGQGSQQRSDSSVFKQQMNETEEPLTPQMMNMSLNANNADDDDNQPPSFSLSGYVGPLNNTRPPDDDDDDDDNEEEEIVGGHEEEEQNGDNGDEDALILKTIGDDDSNKEMIAALENDDMLIASTVNTKGMDLIESEEDDNEQQNELNQSRNSEEDIFIPPSKVKNNNNNNDSWDDNKNDEFNDIGINQYNEIDDDVNQMNNRNDMDDLPVQRVYTAGSWRSCCWCALLIVIIGIALPFLKDIYPEQFNYMVCQNQYVNLEEMCNHMDSMSDSIMKWINESYETLQMYNFTQK